MQDSKFESGLGLLALSVIRPSSLSLLLNI